MKIVDLFSGAGGLTFGFYYKLTNGEFCKTDNEFIVANEYFPAAAQAFKKNFPDINMQDIDIRDLTKEKIEKLIGNNSVDLIVGGPPCQSFSTVGQRRFDDKAKLYEEYLRILKIVRPKMFLFENVKGLLSMREVFYETDENGNIKCLEEKVERHGKIVIKKKPIITGYGDLIIDKIKEQFAKIDDDFGYDIYYQTLNAVDFGVPQYRERVFIIGIRKDLKLNWDWNFEQEKSNSLTIEEAISDLPAVSEDEAKTEYLELPKNDYQKRIETNISASCFNLWNECSTGTLIKLCDVDMRKIGEARLKALPVILSDYYLSDIISCSIEICILDEFNRQLRFTPISKHISFGTMFGMFDNTSENYLSKIPSDVYITKKFEIPAAVEEKCKTYQLHSFENTSGVIKMQNLAGEVISANYQLDGWIAIHSSLDSDVLKRNNPNYNKTIYHPNALRLYVRGKLAVDNLMTYLGSTQAFSNYIEGEIRFDVLDDDRFEDISTSSREGYKKDDPRIEKLLEIVGKIVTRLIAERISARDNLNKLVAVYKEEQQQKEAAEKKLLEEQLQESKRQVSSAIAEKERVETEIKKERKRIDYIIGVSNVKDNNILPSMHSVYNLALLSKKKISKLEEYVHTLPAQAHNILENLGETNNQILYISKAISKANYLVDSERKKIDLIDFFAEYIYRIGKKLYGSKIKTDIQDR